MASWRALPIITVRVRSDATHSRRLPRRPPEPAGTSLAWLSPDKGSPPRHFGVGDNPGRSVAKIAYANTPYFGPPVVCDPYLFAARRDGGINLFGLTRVLQ